MQELKLNGNRVAGSRGSVPDIFRPFIGIPRLHLNGLCLGEKLGEELRPLIPKFRGMKFLDMRGNNLGKLGLDLKKRLRGCKVLL